MEPRNIIYLPVTERVEGQPELRLESLRQRLSASRRHHSEYDSVVRFGDDELGFLLGGLQTQRHAELGWVVKIPLQKARAISSELDRAARFLERRQIHAAGAVEVYWSRRDGLPVWSRAFRGVIVERQGNRRVKIHLGAYDFGGWAKNRPTPPQDAWFDVSSHTELGYEPRRRHWRYRDSDF